MNNSMIPMWELLSRRERLSSLADLTRWKLRLYDPYLKVDYSRVDRVVFVCKGNICRSAYAEARFNMGSAGIRALSAGVEAQSERPANPDAIRFAAERGVDLTSHRTRNIRELMLQSGDLLVCMEAVHARAAGAVAPEGCQVLLLGGLVGLPRISDPYNKGRSYFDAVFSRIDGAVEVLIKSCK